MKSKEEIQKHLDDATFLLDIWPTSANTAPEIKEWSLSMLAVKEYLTFILGDDPPVEGSAVAATLSDAVKNRKEVAAILAKMAPAAGDTEQSDPYVITQESFARYVAKTASPLAKKFVTEKVWLALPGERVIGTILLDNTDYDWSAIALIKHSDGLHRMVDGKVSITSLEGAVGAAKILMQHVAHKYKNPPRAR